MLFSLFWLVWPFLQTAGVLGVGTMATTDEMMIFNFINIMAGCMLPLRGIWYIIYAIRKKTQIRLSMLIQTMLEIAIVPVIIFLPNFSYHSFLVILAIYFSLQMAVHGVNTVIYRRNRIRQYFIPSLCQTVLFFNLFAGVLFLPEDIRHRFVMSGAGFVLSMLGHSYICEILSIRLKNKRAAGVFRKISIIMPGFSGLGIPFRLLRILRNDRHDNNIDAEVIFNYGRNGNGLAGHCELCVDGRTYTYGNYDPDSRAILQTMGNGIIFRAEKKKYIDFLKSNNRTVVVYGLKFNDEQRKEFRSKLSDFDASLIHWRKEAEATPQKEYIHRVLEGLDAEVYRINEGRFKTYFLPTINCVTLTSSLLKGTAAGNIVIPGVYTPGSYMEALHRLYIAGNDVVVSVNVYNS